MSQRNEQTPAVGDLVQLCFCDRKGRSGVLVEIIPPVSAMQEWKTIYKVLIDGAVMTYSKSQIVQAYNVQ